MYERHTLEKHPHSWTSPKVPLEMGSPTGIKDRVSNEGAHSWGGTPTKHVGQNEGKRNAGKGTKQGKRSLNQPIRIEGNPNERKKPANHRSSPKLDFVQTKDNIFLKAVE